MYTKISELWLNPFYSEEVKLEIADGAIQFRDKVISNLRKRIEILENQLKEKETMGYYTKFVVETDSPTQEYTDQIIQEIAETGGFTEDYLRREYCDSMKWYNYVEHVLKVSRNHRTTLIKVFGEGEESGDIWVHYFRNGLHTKKEANIIFPPLEEGELD